MSDGYLDPAILDDPGFKLGRGGVGGRQPGTGGPGVAGPAGGYGGFYGSGTQAGGILGNPAMRRRIPGQWMQPSGSVNVSGSLPTGATPAFDEDALGSSSAAGSTGGGGGTWMARPQASAFGKSRGSGGGGRPGNPAMRPPSLLPPRPTMTPMGGPSPAGSPWDAAEGQAESGDAMDALRLYLLAGAGREGAFSTTGPSGLMDAVRANALSDAQAGQQHARTAAALYAGNDPTAAGYANLRGEMDGQRGVSDALGQATLGRLGAQNDLQQWLLKNGITFNQGWRSADQAGTLGRVATGEANRGQGGFGGWLGNMAGNIGSSWLSRPGGR